MSTTIVGSAANFLGSREALQELSEPWERGDKIKAAIARAARCTGLPYWRAFNIWYGKARRIEPSEHAAIAAALERKRDLEARNELHELRLRLTRLEALLATTDRPVAHSDRTVVRADGLARRPLAVTVSK